MNLDSIKLAPLFMACCVVCILATANSIKPSVDKIIYFKIDTAFYQNNPVKKPSPLFIDGDIKIDLEKKGKQLSTKEVTLLNSLIEDKKYHGAKECGTLWKDGVFVYYDSKNRETDYVILSLECYDLLLHSGKDRINLNEKGIKLLYTLVSPNTTL